MVTFKSMISFNSKRSKFIPTCYHCGRIGYIKPRCFNLSNDSFRNVRSSLSTISRSDSNLLTSQVSKLAKQVDIMFKSLLSSFKTTSNQVWRKDATL